MDRIDARDRLIVALDLPSPDAAMRAVEDLAGVARFFKIGLTLQLAPGVESLIDGVLARGMKVFLDYKYYDIPATLGTAVKRASERGVSFLTIHGPSSLIQAAVKAKGDSPVKLFTVTVLTSMDAGDLAEMGYTQTPVQELVLFRARKAIEAGCDGVIASGQEAGLIKQLAESQGKPLLVVTPGIRSDGSVEDDQKRVATPKGAVLAGADYLVIGRPIYDAQRMSGRAPRQAAEAIVAEMQEAFDQRQK